MDTIERVKELAMERNLTLYMDGHKRLYHGSNAFPPLWMDLVALFQPYLREADAALEKAR